MTTPRTITIACVLLLALPVSAVAQRATSAPVARWEYGSAATWYDGNTIRELRWSEGDSTITVSGNQFGEIARRIAGRPVPGDGFHTWWNALGEKGWELVLCETTPTGAPGGRFWSCYFKRPR
jgi:hypothetical protein